MLVEPNPPTRILVVDDHTQFRQFISSMLQEQSNLKVIGEAEDGLDAVQQAQALQPDLILLDIGLPSLNGIEAARQIGQLASKARIIFLTQESSPEVVREALALGAWGYVVKAHAGSDLLAAVDAVSHGKRFVTNGFDGHGNRGVG
jgi:DNA-binding NarL/FixJ family response regulator